MTIVLEDGKQKVTVNTIGYNPKDITVDVTEEEVTIKSKKGENSSRFVKDIDLTLTVDKLRWYKINCQIRKWVTYSPH